MAVNIHDETLAVLVALRRRGPLLPGPLAVLVFGDEPEWEREEPGAGRLFRARVWHLLRILRRTGYVHRLEDGRWWLTTAGREHPEVRAWLR